MTIIERFPKFLMQSAALGTLIFYVIQLYITETTQIQRDKAASSINRISEYSSGELLDHRLLLMEFWVKHSNIVTAAKVANLQKSDFSRFLLSAMSDDARSLRSFIALSGFFDDLNYCVGKMLCDAEIVNEFFCGPAQSFHNAYNILSERLRDELQIPNFGIGVEEFNRKCHQAS